MYLANLWRALENRPAILTSDGRWNILILYDGAHGPFTNRWKWESWYAGWFSFFSKESQQMQVNKYLVHNLDRKQTLELIFLTKTKISLKKPNSRIQTSEYPNSTLYLSIYIIKFFLELCANIDGIFIYVYVWYYIVTIIHIYKYKVNDCA